VATTVPSGVYIERVKDRNTIWDALDEDHGEPLNGSALVNRLGSGCDIHIQSGVGVGEKPA